jgi:hypothetical protein
MIETALASAAVSFILTKAAEGAVQSVGSDVYKITIEKLKCLLGSKFMGQPEFDQVEQNQDGLIKLITDEIQKKPSFKTDLEELVNQLKSFSEPKNKECSSYENVDSVVNTEITGDVSSSNISGRDSISGNTVSGNSNVIGGDQRGSTFR